QTLGSPRYYADRKQNRRGALPRPPCSGRPRDLPTPKQGGRRGREATPVGAGGWGRSGQHRGGANRGRSNPTSAGYPSGLAGHGSRAKSAAGAVILPRALASFARTREAVVPQHHHLHTQQPTTQGAFVSTLLPRLTMRELLNEATRLSQQSLHR